MLKIFRTICFIIVSIALHGCYSDFLVKELGDQNLLMSKDISKLSLKDGSTIFLDDKCRKELSGQDTLIITDTFENKKIIAINSVNGVLLHRFDERKTFYTIIFGGIGLFFILHGFGIIHWPVRI